jgi:hypothetical protein
MNIADGTYAARPGAASVYESEKGALVLALVVKIENGPELKSYHTLVNRDGSINTRTVDNLKAWSGWDGVDPFWFMENDLSAAEVEVVIANEPGFTDPTKTFPKVKWVNPPGGGGNKMPESADKRAVLAKYGAKFRAVAGGTPVGAGAPPRRSVNSEQSTVNSGTAATGRGYSETAGPAAPPYPVRPPVLRSAQAGGTQAGAWARLCALGAKLTQEQREEIWFAAVDATGTDQVDMTPAGWAQVQTTIEARFAGGPPSYASSTALGATAGKGAVPFDGVQGRPLSVQGVASGPLPAAGDDDVPF